MPNTTSLQHAQWNNLQEFIVTDKNLSCKLCVNNINLQVDLRLRVVQQTDVNYFNNKNNWTRYLFSNRQAIVVRWQRVRKREI